MGNGDEMADKFDAIGEENGRQQDSSGQNAIDAQGVAKLQLTA